MTLSPGERTLDLPELGSPPILTGSRTRPATEPLTTQYRLSPPLVDELFQVGEARGRILAALDAMDPARIEVLRQIRCQGLAQRLVAITGGDPGTVDSVATRFRTRLSADPGPGPDFTIAGSLEAARGALPSRSVRGRGTPPLATGGKVLRPRILGWGTGVVPLGEEGRRRALRDLESWVSLQAAGATRILTAGILLANLLSLTPDGVAPEMAAAWVGLDFLGSAGLNPRNLVTMSPVFMRGTDGPLSRVEDGWWSRDLTGWLETFLRCFRDDHTTLLKLITDWSKTRPVKEEGVPLNPRQRQVLKHIADHGFITNRDYRKIHGVSNKTAHQELKVLVENRLVQKVGLGRAVQYRRISGND